MSQKPVLSDDALQVSVMVRRMAERIARQACTVQCSTSREYWSLMSSSGCLQGTYHNVSRAVLPSRSISNCYRLDGRIGKYDCPPPDESLHRYLLTQADYHTNGRRGTGEWPDLRYTKAIDRARLPPLHLRIQGADDNRFSEDDGSSRRPAADERIDAT